MSTELYVGIGDKARKVGKFYVGVDGKAREVKKAYVGDSSGKARLWWTTEVPFEPPVNCLEFVEADSNIVSGGFSVQATKKWDGVLYYNNGSGWTEWDGSEISSAELNGKHRLYFRGKGNTVVSGGTSSSFSWKVADNYKMNCKGNIETLLDYEVVANGQHPSMGDYCYSRLFYNCYSLTTPPELPATTLTSYCYYGMFQNCGSLTAAPELPATTLKDACYSGMFYGCSSLAVAPELPATTLANSCYENMFYNCSSLTTVPGLPATTMSSRCYSAMFSGCSSLVIAPKLPATTLAGNCYNQMFYKCSSLKTTPELPATTLNGRCYYRMFAGCSSLTSAPELPAIVFDSGCYEEMFMDCKSINIYTTLKSYSWTAPDSTYTNGMFSGCKLDDISFSNYGTPVEGTVYYWDNPGVVNKGEIIQMNLDGTERQYRVLKCKGDVAEVLTMWDVSVSQTFGSNKKYNDSNLDTYLNTTWYNTLSAEAKNAIVPKNITQDSWYSGTSGNPQYSGTYGTSVPGSTSYTISKDSDSYAATGDRCVYAMSIQEVLDYLSDSNVLVDETALLRNQNIWKMFWNTTTRPSNYSYPWLRSAKANSSYDVWVASGANGSLNYSYAKEYHAVRGAFQINLSKIPYTLIE